MPMFLVERAFADELELNKEAFQEINRINNESDVKWLYSFLSADKKKTYCMYEAANAECIRVAARRANIPADAIIEVGETLRPEMFI